MNEFEKRLLGDFQKDFPLVPRPYAEIAGKLGGSEEEILETLEGLGRSGGVSRIGAVFSTPAVGAGTLAAMAVAEEKLEEVAGLVNGYEEVNHNYQRQHEMNLWFVVTAADQDRVDEVIGEIGRRTGIEVLNLPMIEAYHLDLGFDLQWS